MVSLTSSACLLHDNIAILDDTHGEPASLKGTGILEVSTFFVVQNCFPAFTALK